MQTIQIIQYFSIVQILYVIRVCNLLPKLKNHFRGISETNLKIVSHFRNWGFGLHTVIYFKKFVNMIMNKRYLRKTIRLSPVINSSYISHHGEVWCSVQIYQWFSQLHLGTATFGSRPEAEKNVMNTKWHNYTKHIHKKKFKN